MKIKNNVQKTHDTQLANLPALEFFVNHFRYWEDGEKSTVLVDSYGTLIATFNRGTKEVEKVESAWVWQESYYYQLSGDYNSPLSYKKINLWQE